MYLGFLILSFFINLPLVVSFIDFLYSKKITVKNETGEVRKTLSPLFAKLREKHSHKAGTPTGLGMLLVFTIPLIFLLSFGVFLFPQLGKHTFSNFNPKLEVLVLILNFISFALIGLYDDILKVFGFAKTGVFGLKRWHKFIWQWIVALITASLLYFALKISFLHLYFVTLNLGIFYIPLAAFIIVTFANAFDITSGLDGLGEGLLIICLLAFWIICSVAFDDILQVFIAVWVGALIAATYFTVNPARAFLGNASGLAFGSTLALVGLLSGKILPLLIIGGVFLFDGGSSFVQIIGKEIFKKRIFPIAPIHHTFELSGWDEPKVVARFWLVGIVLGITGLWLALIK